MRQKKSRDLFDDTTMSFGEHLEVLRAHLWKAVIALFVCVVMSLFFGNWIIDIVRQPIDEALQRHGMQDRKIDDLQDINFPDRLKQLFFTDTESADDADESASISTNNAEDSQPNLIEVEIRISDLSAALHEADPDRWDEPAESDERTILLPVRSPAFAQLSELKDAAARPVTLNVQEAFVTYLKVCIVAGFVIASPWIFYQIWLFVAAGLFPHERRHVYLYLPISITLFLSGAVFCFLAVFPFVLDFLLGFNRMMSVIPQIRLSEWISFAIMLPVMFGLSFQLPLVMLFLERISIFEVDGYRNSRRMAVLVIAVVSMMMTPADPMSMLMMMFPLIGLYELGIVLCRVRPSRKSPFPEAV